MPSWWTSTDVDSTEIEVTEMVYGLVRGLQPEIVVETGAAWGQTSEAIGQALQRNTHGRLHSIEPDEERVKYTRKRCAGLPVTVHQCKSLDFEPPGEVAFAFFDSLHELRVPEFRLYYPHLIKGSIVAFHDAAEHHGLYPHILELEDDGMLLPIRLPTPRGICLAEVL
jgi:predicted O-methyltransferase YrrM